MLRKEWWTKGVEWDKGKPNTIKIAFFRALPPFVAAPYTNMRAIIERRFVCSSSIFYFIFDWDFCIRFFSYSFVDRLFVCEAHCLCTSFHILFHWKHWRQLIKLKFNQVAHFQKPTAATVPGIMNLKEDLKFIGHLRYSNREEPKRSETKTIFCYLRVANVSFYFIPFHCDSFFSGIFFLYLFEWPLMRTGFSVATLCSVLFRHPQMI